MKLNNEEINLLLATAQINKHTPEQAEAMLRGMAVMIAEFEVLKARLVELGEITNTVPARWIKTNEPIVNLEETIGAHMKKYPDFFAYCEGVARELGVEPVLKHIHGIYGQWLAKTELAKCIEWWKKVEAGWQLTLDEKKEQ